VNPADKSLDRSGPSWNEKEERGSSFWIGFIVWGIRRLGSAPLRLLLPLIAGYFCLIDTVARRSSRAYLTRISQIRGTPPPKFRDIYRHVYTFAELLLDRFALWSGSSKPFEVAVHGREHMKRLMDQGKSAMLVGAHLGSFDMLRVVARDAQIPVNVIMYSGNAELINQAFETLDPDSRVRIINFDPHSAQTAFELRSCMERGEFVAVLSDRLGASPRRRITRARFLGKEAAFPEGPFLLAVLMHVPVILTVALKTGPRKYEVFMENLSDENLVSRSERKAAVPEQVRHFASRLEYYCLKAPSQWFNFFDFWAEGDDARD